MTGVLTGFAIIAVIIAAGYVIGRLDLVGEHAPFVISRLVFFVLNPCLLLPLLADADVRELFSSVFAITSLAAVIAFAAFLVVAKLLWRRATPEALLGGAAASYENAGYIGLAVAQYVLGSAAYSVPVMLFQLLLFQPVLLAILDTTTSVGVNSIRTIVTRPFLNPLLIASLVGILIAVFHVPVPDAVLQSFRIVGNATVPLVLIGFGIALRGQRPLKPGTGRRDVLLASALKAVIMPVVAWLLGAFVFHVGPKSLFVVVVLAALPTAQNVFVFAQRYGRALAVTRDTVLITTIAALPVLVIAAAVLAP